MNPGKGRAVQHLKEASHGDEDTSGSEIVAKESEEERSSWEAMTAEEVTISTCENMDTKPAHPSADVCSSDCTSSKDVQNFSKPSLSYVALIAKVILSSPFQKLNLSSIYRAMEEQFPYLQSRGSGWRNSVRHNLSVNDCFVKVSRCEDGRGHYWGVHQAHLKDFQQGNFRQYRKSRGRRERERNDRMVGCLAWMETNCYLRGFCANRHESLSWVDPLCPLQEPGMYQMSSVDWTEAQLLPLSVYPGWEQSCNWMGRCCFPERLPDRYNRAAGRRRHGSQTPTSRLHSWDTDDPRGVTAQSCDSSAMTRSPFSLPGCWCLSPVVTEIINPLPYKLNHLYHR